MSIQSSVIKVGVLYIFFLYVGTYLVILFNRIKLMLIYLCVLSPLQLKTDFLPLLSVIFVSENSLVAAVSLKQSIHLLPIQTWTIKSVVCVFRATTVAPCSSAVTMVERWHLSPSLTSPNRASRGTCLPWSASGTWTREPPPRTATQPWTHFTRTASRKSRTKWRQWCYVFNQMQLFYILALFVVLLKWHKLGVTSNTHYTHYFIHSPLLSCENHL